MATRFTLGNCNYTVLNVGQFNMNAPTLFANAPADLLSAALQKYRLDADNILFQVNTLHIDTGVNRVLIDPGGVDDPARLLTVMQQMGINPHAIDTVIITHGHFDHYSGGVNPAGFPAFPNARYYIQRTEWEHWLREDNPEPQHAEHFRRLLLPIRDCFTLLDGPIEIIPGIHAIGAPGHSPGHMAILIDNRLVHLGDASVSSVYVEHPDWLATFDIWPDTVVQSRIKLLRWMAQENLSGFISHDARPGPGRIVSSGDTWQWVME